MKKYVICSDVHWSQNSSIIRKRGENYSMRLENLIKSLNWVEQLAVEEGCDEVVYAGDTLDRPDMNCEEITALGEVKFSSLQHMFLVGNHESNTYNLRYSTTSIFKKPNSKIITQPIVYEVGDVEVYFIPYISEHKVLLLSDYVNNNDKKKVIITHNDLAGIRYGKIVSEAGFDVTNILDNCTLFLNGHLHNGYVINDRIVLIGNLSGCNFNENAFNYDHYAYILTINDDGTIDLEPRVNPHAFNFYKIYINSTQEIEKLNNLKTNAVVSAVCNSDILPNVEKEIHKRDNIIEYRLVANYVAGNDDTTVDFTIEDHLKQFIEYVQTKIEPSQVLSEELALLGGN